MKYLVPLIFILTAGCVSNNMPVPDRISLAGEWQFRIDSLDQGIGMGWYNDLFGETVKLPGSMAENGKGYEVAVSTDWTGDIIDKSYFTDPKYEIYRQPGNIKIPFWLKPVKYYKGVAWYNREVDLPAEWEGQRIVLFLERCHWESTVFVNGIRAGSENSLAVPHEFDITGQVKPGKNLISARIDNRVIIPVGVNSHSISDHTQSNWNGITGELSLKVTPKVYINDVKVFPDIQKKTAKVVVSIKNPKNIDFKGRLDFRAQNFFPAEGRKLPLKKVNVVTGSDEQQIVLNYKILNPQLWSEFTPNLYRMTVGLKESGKGVIDSRSVDFGMREFITDGTRFKVNVSTVFLRGTTECCIFPLTGYAPTDYGSWEKVLKACRDHGLNHVRFHSFCPPEAAFEAADRLGIYFHVECSSWANQGSTIGDGGALDRWIYQEGDRIMREYGNHPSFCMLAYGNEPSGRNHREYLGKLLKYWKSIDNRRVYTSAAGWPIIPENDFNLPSDPRIQHWGEGLKSIINAEPPQTMFDFRDFVSKYQVPTVGHEIGQWCVYPDFKEIAKYSGVLKPTNFEIFRETLEKNNMGDQAEDFLLASGKLQALCYKADIEAALRTPGFAGFQLLQLHDFPGQGTALVGVLDPFFEEKGYISPEEFRMFCNETVPLARIGKMTLRNDETFRADIEIAHFGAGALKNADILCEVKGMDNRMIYSESFAKDLIENNNCIPVGSVSVNLSGIGKAEKLSLEVSVVNTPFRNKWEFWVYPSDINPVEGDVYITDVPDSRAADVLIKGGKVLLLAYGKAGKDKGAQVAIGFSSIFWNTAWTNNQAPHTLGILCDPKHPLFSGFPTEFHSNWQWWDPVTHSQAMIIDDLPPGLRPLIQPIDTWFENRRLALAFEVRAGNGKLLVCSINMKDDLDQRPVTKQLLSSALKYMNSNFFDPDTEIDLKQIRNLLQN
ncbi:MAG: beta-galactosidase [Bacteroidales bacterium]|nr:beta-galactosidase [Bacteroidales bacterium]